MQPNANATEGAGSTASVSLLHTRASGAPQDVQDVVIKIDLELEKVRSHIADGDEFHGDLKCKTGIQISGVVHGSVTCTTGAIVLDKTGHVTGKINGNEKIFIDGRVGNEEDGNGTEFLVSTPGLITLQGNAVVNGGIEYGLLSTYGNMTHNGMSRKIKATSR